MTQRSLRPAAAFLTAAALVLSACSSTNDDEQQTVQPGPTSAGPTQEATDTSSEKPTDGATTGQPTEGATSGKPTKGQTSSPSKERQHAVGKGPKVTPRTASAAVEGFYGGDNVPVADYVAKKRGTKTTGASALTLKSHSGEWKGGGVATVMNGNDLTFVVRPAGQKSWKVVGGWWPSLGIDDPVLGGKRHVLIMGSDAREREGEPVDRMRADALQVLGVDGKSGGGVLGIARDSWVTHGDGRTAKINTGLLRGGPSGQVETVKKVTGLPIEGYLLIGMLEFRDMINDLGGLQIDIPKRVKMIPKGKRTLTGTNALRYARERKTLPDGDFGRSRHQGDELLALGAQARLGGPAGLPDMMTVASKYVTTDLSAEQALTLGAWLYVLSPSQMGRHVAKGSIGWSNDRQSIVRLDAEARAAFKDFADGNLK